MVKIFQKFQITNRFTAIIVIVLTGLLFNFVARPYPLTLGPTKDGIERSMPGGVLFLLAFVLLSWSFLRGMQ